MSGIWRRDLRALKIMTSCDTCLNKCCSQPYDWVYVTAKEIDRLKAASTVSEAEFIVERKNSNTGHVFRTLNLPCCFLDPQTGMCSQYESRPLICRLFPFYPEPLTGDATLLPAQCGVNLQILSSTSSNFGWCLADLQRETTEWLSDIWSEATILR